MKDGSFDWKKVETQIDELRGQVRDLLRRLDSAVGKEAEALRPKLKAAQHKLRELKKTSGEAWTGDVKPGLEKAWDELHNSLNQAAARFKKPPQE